MKFAIAFFLVGFLLSSPVIAAETTKTLEAEAMIKAGGSNRAVTDGWALMGAGTLTEKDFLFRTKHAVFDVIARGDFAGGAWPLMEIRIDGVVAKTVTIDSATWKTFVIDIPVTPGTHDLAFAFINDYWQDPADRNFYMDKATIKETLGTAAVSLAWDANTEPDLAGYKIYYGFASGDYPHTVDVANVTEWTLINLTKGITYYLAATAYDEDDNESAFSVELVHTPSGYDKPGKGTGLSHKPLIFEWISKTLSGAFLLSSRTAAGMTAPSVSPVMI